MSLYLGYSYSSGLSKEEEQKINKRVHESRKELCKGASDSLKVCLTVQSIYSLTTQAAYASDQCPANTPGKDVAKPKPKPGFKPLTRRQVGASTSAGGTICAIALASGDYLLGGACVMLVFVFLNIVNRG